jgi:hypothetical protein
MPYLIEVSRVSTSGSVTCNDQTQFIVCAKGPCGFSWLSKLSALGLRTLVTRELAQTFPTLEAAESAINKMPTGYKLARISFEVTVTKVVRHQSPTLTFSS